MLKQLIFLVDKNIELPKYEDSEVQILNADTGKTSITVLFFTVLSEAL